MRKWLFLMFILGLCGLINRRPLQAIYEVSVLEQQAEDLLTKAEESARLAEFGGLLQAPGAIFNSVSALREADALLKMARVRKESCRRQHLLCAIVFLLDPPPKRQSGKDAMAFVVSGE